MHTTSLFVSSALLLSVSALTSPGQVGGGLTIVSDNDLTSMCAIIAIRRKKILIIEIDAPGNSTGAAILIDGEFEFAAASAKCSALGETLFPRARLSTLKNIWSYATHSRKLSSGQQIWILQNATQPSNGTQSTNSTQAATCDAVNVNGRISRVSCAEKLPIICTQSAPVSTAKTANKADQFQISQQVGTQTITGFRDFYSFRFLGVRYAPQPKRWTYSTVFDGPANQSALNYGSKCAQPGGVGSEDCLFLNIFTPFMPTVPTQEELKPVMVWIHGGGFKTESNQDINHDGTNLASRGDVVVVQLNYRLGNLGFLTLNNTVTGNYGIQDMITGLQWVKKYVSTFGGDPDKVTIYGESAGGAGVRALLGSPKADGLFHNAIMISSPGGVSGDEPFAKWMSVADMHTRVGEKVLEQTGCSKHSDPLGCLQLYDGVKLAGLSAVAT